MASVPRPRRNPSLPTVKATVYVDPGTLERMKAQAGARSLGALLDEMFDPTLEANYDFTDPPSTPEWSTKESATGHIPAKPRIGTPEPVVKVHRRHSWKANSVGVNVCAECGVQKAKSTDPHCPGGTE